ncbi:MAG: Uma2 family endonuclease [Thermaceae bacterium]|nr:Uma2 family endonuclease [Thermaceae bacterium]
MAIRHRFSIEEFERLYQDVQNIELLEGEIYHMSPIGPKHNYRVMQLNHRLSQLFGERARVQVQGSIRLLDKSEPQPDFSLVKLPEEQYQSRLPQENDVILIIEVSDSTLAYDRDEKLPAYAEAGISEYWIVNLNEDVLEVYREPIGRNYRSRTLYRAGEPVEFMGERLEWW